MRVETRKAKRIRTAGGGAVLPGRQLTTHNSQLTLVLLWTVLPLTIAALMAYYLLASRQAAGELGFPLDDSWIHVRFAQNLAGGKGFSFNPGVPTSTTTSVLWTLLLALCYRITHEYLFTTFVVNWALCVLACVVVYQLALTLTPSRWAALTAAAAAAVTAPLPWWALSGMEPPLYALLALLGILLHVRQRSLPSPSAKALALTALVMALAALARPELLLLLPLALVDRLIMLRWVEKDEQWAGRWAKQAAVQAPVFGLLIAPVFVYNHAVTGYWLPSSFYSKLQPTSAVRALQTGQASLLVSVPLQELWALVAQWAANNWLLILPFFAGLVWLVMITIGVPRQSGDSHRIAHRVFSVGGDAQGNSVTVPALRASLLVPLLLIVQPALGALASGFRPPGFQSQRYVAHLDLLYVLLAVLGGYWLTSYVKWRQPVVRAALAVAVLAVSLVGQPASARIYALNVQNITGMQVNIARWIHTHAPKDALLAVNDVGAIGVLAGNPVLDLQGLVTPEALPVRARDLQRVSQGQPPGELAQFVFDHHPDYVIIFPDWYPEIAGRGDLLTEVYDVVLADNITSGRDTMKVYETVWARERRKR